MQEGDCMAVGLQISRTEGTIGDPSQLKIHDIYPTFISVDGFLESAKFKLEDDSLAHGGFSKVKGDG